MKKVAAVWLSSLFWVVVIVLIVLASSGVESRFIYTDF